MPLVDGGVVLHAGVAAGPGIFSDLAHDVARRAGGDGVALFDGAGGELLVALDGGHELVGDADGVVGVLEEDGAIGLGVRATAVVAGGDEGVGFGFFLGLALDEVDDVGVVDVEDDHLGGAAGLASGLDDAGEGVEAAHEGEGARGGAAAGEGLHGAADGAEVGTGARTPLEEHALGLGEGEDGVERVLDGVDEAGGALGLGVAGGGEGDLAGGGVPVPVLGVGVGLQAVAADVEPDGGVEGDLLVDEEVDELGVEGVGGGVIGEVTGSDAPVAHALRDTGDEGADAGFTLGGADQPVQIFRGDDVGGGHAPVGGALDVFLLEDELSLPVLDDGVAELPLDLVVGADAGGGEVAVEGEAASGDGRLGGDGGGGFGDGFLHGWNSFKSETEPGGRGARCSGKRAWSSWPRRSIAQGGDGEANVGEPCGLPACKRKVSAPYGVCQV